MDLSEVALDEMAREFFRRGYGVDYWKRRTDAEIAEAHKLEAWRRRVIPAHRSSKPSDRVYGLLCRVSRERIIQFDEYKKIVYAASQKFSGNWWSVAQSFRCEYPDNLYHSIGYFKGCWLRAERKTYKELALEATKEHRQFINIAAYRRAKLQQQERLCEKNINTLYQIKQEIRNVRKDRNGRPASPVPSQHAVGG